MKEYANSLTVKNMTLILNGLTIEFTAQNWFGKFIKMLPELNYQS